MDEEERARRRKSLLIGLGVVGAVVVVATLLAAALFNGVGDDYSSTEDQLGLNPNSSLPASGDRHLRETRWRHSVFTRRRGR